MNTSDRFLRFAAECEVMAKFSRTPENRLSGAGWQNDGFAAPSLWTAKIRRATAAAS
jgi:hypothetical protein